MRKKMMLMMAAGLALTNYALAGADQAISIPGGVQINTCPETEDAPVACEHEILQRGFPILLERYEHGGEEAVSGEWQETFEFDGYQVTARVSVIHWNEQSPYSVNLAIDEGEEVSFPGAARVFMTFENLGALLEPRQSTLLPLWPLRDGDVTHYGHMFLGLSED